MEVVGSGTVSHGNQSRRSGTSQQLIAVLWIQIVISGYGLRNLPQFGSGSEPFHRNTSSISRGGEDFPTIFFFFFFCTSTYVRKKKLIKKVNFCQSVESFFLFLII